MNWPIFFSNMRNSTFRKFIFIGFPIALLITFSLISYDTYKDAQPNYEKKENGATYIHARGSDFFLWDDLKFPNFVPENFIPIMKNDKVTKYEFETDKDEKITKAYIAIRTKNTPEKSFNEYKKLLGDKFEYITNFKYNILGTYNDLQMRINFLTKKDPSNYYLIIIELN